MSNITKVYIYILCDPRDQAIRYVGKSVNPMDRYRHAGGKHEKGTWKGRWARHLVSLGLNPIMQIVAETDEEHCVEEERWWIAHLREAGHDLTNLTDGGEGESGWNHSTKTKQQISDALMGHEVSEDTKIKLRLANDAQFKDPMSRERHRQSLVDWQANLSEEEKKMTMVGLEQGRFFGPAAMKAKWESMSQAERDELSARQHAWQYDPNRRAEFIAHQKKALAKRWANPDAHIVGPQSEEHKVKTSTSMKSFWASKTPEERRAIALSNWAKRRAAAEAIT